jgi:hypothetical protein
VGSIDKRIADLERRIAPPSPEDEGRECRLAIMRQILDELAALTACRARNSYRGGNPPTPIQPTDPAGEALGYPYTKGQLMVFAVRRVIEREFAPQLDSGEGGAENVIEAWVYNMRMLCEQAVGPDSWDEVEAEGPPAMTPPWRGGC